MRSIGSDTNIQRCTDNLCDVMFEPQTLTLNLMGQIIHPSGSGKEVPQSTFDTLDTLNTLGFLS